MPRSATISDLYRRRGLALATVAVAAILNFGLVSQPAVAAPGPISVGSDGFARFDVAPEPGAAQVWVEVEGPGLTAADIVVRLNGVDQPVTTTALGAITVIPASTGTQSLAVALITDADPDIAVTMIDGSGNVLSSASYHVVLVDFRDLPQSAPNGGGFLASTGLAFGLYVALTLVGGAAILLGAFISGRKREVIQ